MWIQVRTIDGSQTRTIEDVSRKATIEELRERVWALFDVRPECQRLFYRGKQVRRAHRTPSGIPGRGLQGAARTRGLGRPQGLVRRARREHLAPLWVCSARGSECRPRPRRGDAAGSVPAPKCRCSWQGQRRRRPDRGHLAPPLPRPFQRGGSRWHSPP